MTTTTKKTIAQQIDESVLDAADRLSIDAQHMTAREQAASHAVEVLNGDSYDDAMRYVMKDGSVYTVDSCSSHGVGYRDCDCYAYSGHCDDCLAAD